MDATSETARSFGIEYFVGGEPQRSLADTLTPIEILERAGCIPATEYELIRDRGHHTYLDYVEQVHLDSGNRFTANFIGPTPTS